MQYQVIQSLVLGYFDSHKDIETFEVASKASMKDYLPVVVAFTESPKLLYTTPTWARSYIVNHEREHKDEVAR